MWSVMIVLLFIMAFIFMLLGYYFVEKENILLSTVFILVATVLWFTLAAAIVEIEFPYTAIQNDNTIINGVHTWGDSTAVSLMYLFIMLGAIEIVYGLGTIPRLVFKIWNEEKEKRLRR